MTHTYSYMWTIFSDYGHRTHTRHACTAGYTLHTTLTADQRSLVEPTYTSSAEAWFNAVNTTSFGAIYHTHMVRCSNRGVTGHLTHTAGACLYPYTSKYIYISQARSVLHAGRRVMSCLRNHDPDSLTHSEFAHVPDRTTQ